MADNELSEYTVEINGIEHTMQLDEETAKRYGDAARKSGGKVKAAEPVSSEQPTTEAKAVMSPANKSRSGTTK
jgi:hypothetical protein